MTVVGEVEGLVSAVETLREAVDRASLPLDVPTRARAEASRRALLQQLDDYVVPRLRSLDAPLLAVVGGSTGAGKSTLVNSVIGSTVSRSGVLRPTTTSPVLVHHPDDRHWFEDARILPDLARVTGGTVDDEQHGTVRLVESTALPAGMALLDAPDIDSVVSANRAVATQLLSAADLWLFVTTAARYADAVPWDLLRTAADRGTAVAIVLDRIPGEAVDEIRPHLAAMLREQGLPTAPIFTVPETTLDADGRLPEEAVARAARLAPGPRRRRPGPLHRRQPDPARRHRVARPAAPPSSSWPAVTSRTPPPPCASPPTTPSPRPAVGSATG